MSAPGDQRPVSLRDGLAARDATSLRSLITAGTVLGLGVGGFVDGILFHQILQLHNMLSAKYPVRGVDGRTLAVHLEVNMFWDGLFHAACWAFTVAGVCLLWGAVRRRDVPVVTKTFAGSVALGYGIFNLVEGAVDHHILHVHHVTETENHLVYDLLFLASGLVLIGAGRSMVRAGTRPPARAA